MLSFLPNFILDDIISYLDVKSLCEVSLASKQFHAIALPLLFRELTVYEAWESKDQELLKKRGGLVKGLTLPRATVISDLGDDCLSLTQVFPQLSALYIQTVYTLSHYFYEKFVDECMKATSLKHVAIFGRISSLPDRNMFAPVISKLDSVYFNSLPLFIIENPQLYMGLKKLGMPIEYLSVIPKIAKGKPFPFEIVFFYPNLPRISLNSGLHEACKWVQYENKYGLYHFKVSNNTKYKELLLEFEATGSLVKDFPGIHFAGSGTEEKMLNVPSFVEYCAVTCHGVNDGLAIGHLNKVPSISIDSLCFQDSLKLTNYIFSTTKLSLRTREETFPTFFQWAIDCFPNLEHFFVVAEFYDDFLLPPNCFPNLVHFSLAANQLDTFWPKLIRAAPKLQYIYTDQLLARVKLEIISPILQVKPFENIVGCKGDFNDSSGFGEYL